MARSRSRSRSRSPRPERRPEHRSGGFRWKDKSRADRDGNRDSRRGGEGLDRGYNHRRRSRSPRRDRDRDRDWDGEGRSGRDREQRKERAPREEKKERPPKPVAESTSGTATPTGPKKTAPADPVPAPAPAPVAAGGEPMIIVNVNDRLGTKAAIPCLASDPVGLFKAQVAARIGRQTHEILLKRQGERPFKDQLTLEDYGVSNGVQLDLELDTGD